MNRKNAKEEEEGKGDDLPVSSYWVVPSFSSLSFLKWLFSLRNGIQKYIYTHTHTNKALPLRSSISVCQCFSCIWGRIKWINDFQFSLLFFI